MSLTPRFFRAMTGGPPYRERGGEGDHGASNLLIPLDIVADPVVAEARRRYHRLATLTDLDIRNALLMHDRQLLSMQMETFAGHLEDGSPSSANDAQVQLFRALHPSLAWMSSGGISATVILAQGRQREEEQARRRQEEAAARVRLHREFPSDDELTLNGLRVVELDDDDSSTVVPTTRTPSAPVYTNGTGHALAALHPPARPNPAHAVPTFHRPQYFRTNGIGPARPDLSTALSPAGNLGNAFFAFDHMSPDNDFPRPVAPPSYHTPVHLNGTGPANHVLPQPSDTPSPRTIPDLSTLPDFFGDQQDEVSDAELSSVRDMLTTTLNLNNNNLRSTITYLRASRRRRQALNRAQAQAQATARQAVAATTTEFAVRESIIRGRIESLRAAQGGGTANRMNAHRAMELETVLDRERERREFESSQVNTSAAAAGASGNSAGSNQSGEGPVQGSESGLGGSTEGGAQDADGEVEHLDLFDEILGDFV